MHYIRELGVELETSDLVDTDFAYFVGGRFAGTDPASLNRLGLPLNDEERRMSADQMVDRYVQAVCRELQPEIGAPAWRVTERMAPYDLRSVHQVLRERGASDAAIDLMEPYFLEMRGGDLKSASALAWLRHEASPHSWSRRTPGGRRSRAAPTSSRAPSPSGSGATSTTAERWCEWSRTAPRPA